MHRIVNEIGGDLIAIAAIVMGIGFAMFSLYLHSRRKREFLQMHHAERRAAIEKGIELPPVPPQFFQDGPAIAGPYCCGRRRSGVGTLLVGVAVMVALRAQGGNGYWWGLVVIAIGVGRIIDGLFFAHHDVPRVAAPPGPDGRPGAR